MLGGQLASATGEEDLLALYLKQTDGAGQHYFIPVVAKDEKIIVVEGLWKSFKESPQYAAWHDSNRISYAWDQLIESFAQHAKLGTLYRASPYGLSDDEKTLRVLAEEPRIRRRILAKSLFGVLRRSNQETREARFYISKDRNSKYPAHVFLVLPKMDNQSEEDYRELRKDLLTGYCLVVKWLNPHIRRIVALGFSPIYEFKESHDIISAEFNHSLTEEQKMIAKNLHDEDGILKDVKRFEMNNFEYPVKEMYEFSKGRNRNSPCPCGSGLKYKKCCGK